ncbi:MAG: ankyrin repeat domain-containing protein [Verrucomicrobiota bacterium]|nr:ankyrin repeat domain-containing protein [Verrucomicrobiota bacterium]
MRPLPLLPLIALGLATGCSEEIREPTTDSASSTAETVAATNLFHAAQLGDLAAMRQYLAQGESVTNCHPDNSQTALHYAAWGGQTNAIHWLIGKKADVNALDDDGKSPLDYAWMPRGEAARKMLIAAEAKPGAELRPPELKEKNITKP